MTRQLCMKLNNHGRENSCGQGFRLCQNMFDAMGQFLELLLYVDLKLSEYDGITHFHEKLFFVFLPLNFPCVLHSAW